MRKNKWKNRIRNIPYTQNLENGATVRQWPKAYPMPNHPNSIIVEDEYIYGGSTIAIRTNDEGKIILDENGQISLEILTKNEFNNNYFWVNWNEHPKNETLFPNLSPKRDYLDSLKEPSDDQLNSEDNFYNDGPSDDDLNLGPEDFF